MKFKNLAAEVDLTGKAVYLIPGIWHDETRMAKRFNVTGGLGARPNARGMAIFGYFDGEDKTMTTRVERSDILCLADDPNAVHIAFQRGANRALELTLDEVCDAAPKGGPEVIPLKKIIALCEADVPEELGLDERVKSRRTK